MKGDTKKLMMAVAGAVLASGVGFAKEPVAYLDWDGEKLVLATCTEYEVVMDGASTFAAGKTYVVKGDVSTSSRISVEGTMESPTRLILCDGATLTANAGVNVPVNGATTNALVICGQQGDTGVLDANGSAAVAGIGGGEYGVGGTVTINGGMVTATGGRSAAGIGGGNRAAGGTVTVNGGTVTAQGGTFAAGIGGENSGSHGRVAFSSGRPWSIRAGDAAPGVPTAVEEYVADHGARYVKIWLEIWQVGENVQAFTNATGLLTIIGTGAMNDFATPDAVPWNPTLVTAVTVDAGVTKIGVNALADRCAEPSRRRVPAWLCCSSNGTLHCKRRYFRAESFVAESKNML